jgi:hypothetical protein
LASFAQVFSSTALHENCTITGRCIWFAKSNLCLESISQITFDLPIERTCTSLVNKQTSKPKYFTMVSKHFLFSVFVVLVAMGTGTNAAMKALRRGKDVDTDPSVIPQLQKVAPRRRRLNGDVS